MSLLFPKKKKKKKIEKDPNKNEGARVAKHLILIFYTVKSR